MTGQRAGFSEGDLIALVRDLADEVAGLHLALDPTFNLDNCDVYRRAKELTDA